jgi:uncharacterized protein (DUF1015 family)
VAVIRPLAGVHYDPARVGDMARVLAPPYDVISHSMQTALYARSPHNVIRLILPRESDRGPAAAAMLRSWMDERILVAHPTPAIYLYSQTFTLNDGTQRRRDGIICRLQLEDFARGIVRPHERTLPGPKADRLAILRATGTNLSPIFGLYSRPEEPVRQLLGAPMGTPLVDANDEVGGSNHRLWRITDAACIARVEEALADETIIIADGHHRYETALAFRDERGGAEPARYILAYLANMEETGVVILPTHRLVRGPLGMTADELESRLVEDFEVWRLASAQPRAAGEIDCALPDRWLRLRARPAASARLMQLPGVLRGLDIALLHGAVLGPFLGVGPERLDFTHDDTEATQAVREGRAAAAFLLEPPTLAEVRAVCLAGELMPEKSTYFYPKLATGLVFSFVGPPWAKTG